MVRWPHIIGSGKWQRLLLVGGGLLALAACVLVLGFVLRASHTVVTHTAATRPSPSASTPPPSAIPMHLPAAPTTTAPAPDFQLPAVTDGMVPVLSHIPTKQPVVFLTIDDGIVQDPNDLPVMQRAQVPATFFLVYRFIKTNPAFFANLAQATGSDIENHSYDHYLLPNLSYDQQKQDICKNADIFSEWFDKRPLLFRPSGGAYNDDTRRAAVACGMKALIMWNATINNGVIKFQAGSMQPGDIVLMHFRTTFQADLTAFVSAAKAAKLQPVLLIDWLS